MYPDINLTCWEKTHNFYIPNHLFSMKEVSLYISVTIDVSFVSRIQRKSEIGIKIGKYILGFAYKC